VTAPTTAPTDAAPLPWPSARTLAASAAVVVAVAGRGDLLLLGLLLAVALAERRSALAALAALAAVSVRWGTTSAETITGAVTTLGPGLRVGPPHAAIALGLAAVALLLAGLGAPRLPRLAAGVAAGVVAGGPIGASAAGAVVVGLLAVAAGAAVSVFLPRLVPEPSDGLRAVAPVLAVLALALAAVW